MMRRTIYHLLLALTALAATACTADADSDALATDAMGDAVPITFGLAADGTTTRADAEFLVSGTSLYESSYTRQIGLFGHVDGDTSPGDWLFHNDALTVQSDATLAYSPLRYWPTTVGATVSFYAYYPYSDKTDSDATSWSRGVLIDDHNIAADAPIVEFRQAETAADHIDFMYATALKNQAKPTSGARQTLQFHHALAKVTFSISSTGSGVPKQCYLKNAIMSDRFNLADGTWTGAAQRRGYVRSLSSGDVLLMLPQPAGDVKLVFVYDEGGTSHIKETALTGDDWEANGQYSYNITVAL